MPLTKTTQRKQTKCPMCPFKTWDIDELKNHLGECGLRQVQRRFHCDECSYSTNKNANLMRHKKRHSQEDQESAKCTVVSPCPSDEQILIGDISEESDGDELSPEESETEGTTEFPKKTQKEFERPSHEKFSDVEVGRTIRKSTDPTPVQVPKRKIGDEKFQSTLKKTVKAVSKSLPKPKISRPSQMIDEVFKLGRPQIERVPMLETPQVTSKVHAGVQTAMTKRKVVWTTARWKEGDRDMERVEMIEEFIE